MRDEARPFFDVVGVDWLAGALRVLVLLRWLFLLRVLALLRLLPLLWWRAAWPTEVISRVKN